MLSKRPHPVIGRLSELLVSVNHCTGFLDVSTSPRSPLDYKIQSPRGLKNYDLGGVGLGIVAALDKSSASGDGGYRTLAKYAIFSPILNRSDPVPVNSSKKSERCQGGFEDLQMDSLEDYTYVISHGPNESTTTKVYYHGGEQIISGHKRIGFETRCDNFGVIPMPKELPATFVEDVSVYPTSDFLSSCHLCRKNLHGKDIYMYRGEKAFCSVECRSRQIMVDERKEQCRSEVPRTADVSSSSYTRSPIFSTGILAI